MTKTIDRTALASALRYNVASTDFGGVYFKGVMPDEALAEIFSEVAAAKATYDASAAEAGKLRGEIVKARAARSAHKNDADAVYTNDGDLGLVFSDARGVELQNEVKRLEKLAAAHASKSKTALVAYLVEAFSRVPEAKDAFTARAAQADAEAKDLAEKLVATLGDRARYWTLAGQPHRGVSETGRPAAVARIAAEQAQYVRDLEHLLSRALPFPKF